MALLKLFCRGRNTNVQRQQICSARMAWREAQSCPSLSCVALVGHCRLYILVGAYLVGFAHCALSVSPSASERCSGSLGLARPAPVCPASPNARLHRYSSKVKSENCTPTTRAVGPPYAPTFAQFLVRVRVPPSTNVHGGDSASLIHEQEFRSHICLGANASNDAELVAVRGVPGRCYCTVAVPHRWSRLRRLADLPEA